MRFVIVTGVSGAGKTSALKMLEDAKYFCVDNLPIPLLEKFASLMPEIHGEDVQNVALGIDARSGRSLDELEIVLDRMKKAGYDFEILFLDAQDSVLVKRYKETRRSHPLAMGGRVDDGIRMEREKMRFLKERADYIIDTSQLLTRELKGELDHHGARNALRELELSIDAALPKKLVLDLAGVTFMDSSGIALILRAQQRMQLLDGSLLVRNVPQQARRVLDAAGIGRLVTIR